MEIQEKYKNLGLSGCYFFDLLKHFGKVDKAIDYYDKYTNKGWMDYDCFIQRPLDIVKDLSGYPNWDMKKSEVFDNKAEIIVAYYYNPITKLHHFVLHNDRNGLRWDSLEPSNTVKNGYVESYRLFYRR